MCLLGSIEALTFVTGARLNNTKFGVRSGAVMFIMLQNSTLT